MATARPQLVTALTAVFLVSALVPSATAVTMAVLVGAVQQKHAISGALDQTVAPLMLFAAVMLLGHITDAVGSPLQFRAKSSIDGAHRTALVRLAAGVQDLGILEQARVQDLIRLATAEPDNWTEHTPGEGALAQLQLLTRAVGAVSSCLVLAAYSPWLVVALGVPALAGRAIMRRQIVRSVRMWVAGVSEGRRADYWKGVVTSPSGGKELRVFGFGDWVVRRTQMHQRAMFEPVWSMGLHQIRRPWPILVCVAAPLTAVYAIAAGTIAAKHGSLALETAVLGACWSLYLATGMLGDTFLIEGALPGLKAFAELVAMVGGQPQGREASLMRTSSLPSVGRDGSQVSEVACDRAQPPLVRFEDVCFRYPGTELSVLSHLDMEIRPGEMLGIVGLNGAGKSTLIKLLSALYKPSSGRITVDGEDIQDLGQVAWCRHISVVFQDFVQYHLPVRDNVTLGRGATTPDIAAMEMAAREAGLDEVIARLPDGWDTPLARWRNGGVDLSGGQWQQVVLARALYAVRTGARLLVLDEPTAHLDVCTEFDLFARLVDRVAETSVILISHRLSTVRQADRIVLLEGGRITETGSHDELITAGGSYASMFAIQAERFRRGYHDRIEGNGDLTDEGGLA